MSLQNNIKKPAVFLDRDGVLTEENSYVCSLDELHIFPCVEECVRQMKEKGYYTIVITNQSGVARGLFTETVLEDMNNYLVRKSGVDKIYYCPHHPEGKIAAYAKICNCRKPETGLLERACEEYNIDLEHSYMVGDRASDIQLGKNAGLKTVLLESGYGTARLEALVKPDYIVKDLREFIKILN